MMKSLFKPALTAVLCAAAAFLSCDHAGVRLFPTSGAVGAPGTRIFVAENDDKRIVGCATLCVNESPTGRKASVEDVVVLPAYRRQGIGSALVQRIIDFATGKLSPIDLRLAWSPSREEADAFTGSLGFVPGETKVCEKKL